VAQDNEERDAAYHIAEMESNAVDEIEKAIRRLDDGTYGICQECGARIPAARLKALPSATLCVRCKASEETRGGFSKVLPYERIQDVRDAMYDPERIYGSVRGRKLS